MLAQPLGDWSFDDLVEADLPLDPSRYEVVDGCLLVRPEMTVPHDSVRSYLDTWLDPRLPVGWRAQSELAVRLGTDGRRADVGVVRANAAVWRQQVGHHPQDIAMLGEVVSPSSRKTDRLFKPAEYAAAGIATYWRIELEPEPLLVVHRLVGTTYEVAQQLTGRGRVDLPFPLEIDLPALLPPMFD